MRTMTKLLAAAAVAATMGAASAANALVYVSYSTDGGTTLHSLISGDTDTLHTDYVFNNIGGFESISMTVNGGAIFPGLLHTETVEANTTGTNNASVLLYISRTGLTGDAHGYFSQAASTTLPSETGNITADVKVDTYVDDGNAIFGTGVHIGSAHFAQGFGADLDFGPNSHVTGTFSATHIYSIVASGGKGSIAPTATLGATVPEPATWALMIAGFGGAGAMLRRRRTAAAAA